MQKRSVSLRGPSWWLQGPMPSCLTSALCTSPQGRRYRLDSTRGTKQIFSSVTVAGRKLYIVNGSANCAKAEGGGGAECSAAAAAALARAAASFRVD